MDLPFCHSRRYLENETEVFFCAHPRVHARDQRVSVGVCGLCTRWAEPPPKEFRPFPPPPPRDVMACQFLGDLIELRGCDGCGGSVRVKVFACHHPRHGETTLRECGRCPDFEAGVAGDSPGTVPGPPIDPPMGAA